MAGNGRNEMALNSQEGSAFSAGHPSGQRGSYSGPSMERSSSFRESLNNRNLSSSPRVIRSPALSPSADVPLLSQSLMLEPLSLGDQKYNRYGELRRVLGVSVQEHCSGSFQSKPLPPGATEEIKSIKASIQDMYSRARDRAKLLHEQIMKLDRFCNLVAKKRQRNDGSSIEKMASSNLLKGGSQIRQNPSEIVSQRLDERTKNALPNKRIRSSLAESDGRGNISMRQGTVLDKATNTIMEKDSNLLRACSGGLVPLEEKTRGVSSGGDMWEWDKKMKRKRSVGPVVTKIVDGERKIKQTTQQRLSNESRPRPTDGPGFRPGSSHGVGIHKPDINSQPNSCGTRTVLTSDLDNVSLSNDGRPRCAAFDKERDTVKGNNKLSTREDSQLGSRSPLIKGKASRMPRAAASAVMSSSSSFAQAPRVLDGWEQPPTLNKVQPNVATNRKRPLPAGSSPPTVTQWGGQRPQKMSRTRRTNLVPVSCHVEAQTLAEGFSTPDIETRLTRSDTSGSSLSRGMSNSTQQFKVKLENVLSPAVLSESEESGAVETKCIDKGTDNGDAEDGAVNAVSKVANIMLPMKKSVAPSKEEIGDGIRRQGRSGRGSSQMTAGMPLLKEKQQNIDSAKPLRNGRPCTERNESKIGRPPLKKGSDRKAFSRPKNILSGGFSEQTGDLESDNDEILAAANHARDAIYHSCSSSFWKKMEPFFTRANSDIVGNLQKQIAFVEELDGSSFDIGDADHKDELINQPTSQTVVTDARRGSRPNGVGSGRSTVATCFVDRLCEIEADSEKFERDGWLEKIVPLSQRLLAAIITDDEYGGCNDDIELNDLSSQFASDCSYGRCSDVNCGNKYSERKFESGFEFDMSFRTQNNYSRDNSSCNGFVASNNTVRPNGYSYCSDLSQDNKLFPHLEIGVNPVRVENGVDNIHSMGRNFSSTSPYDCQYEHMSLDHKVMLELQSIGLYPEPLPDLTEGGDDGIMKDISKLKMMLYQQMREKKDLLHKLEASVQKASVLEERNFEKIAMDKLVEMSYRKFLGGRGIHGSSNKAVLKVSKQAALTFGKRTLARCRKFEETGKSCFSEPPFNGILSRLSENIAPVNQKLDRAAQNSFPGIHQTPEQPIVKNGLLPNGGKKREVLLDNVGNVQSRAASTLGNTLPGNAKGKRSERDRDHNKDTSRKNSIVKACRPSIGDSKGERKTKTKPKQKTAQLSTSGNGLLGRSLEANAAMSPLVLESCEALGNSCSRNGGTLSSPHPVPKVMEETSDFCNLQLHEMDSIEDLGVSDELGGQGQDIASWLNVDDDILQDNDLMGLEIPMDDLSELNMKF